MKHTKHLAGWGRRTFLTMAIITALLWISGVWMHAWPMEQVFDMSEQQAWWRRSSGVLHGVLTWVFCIMVGRGVWPHVRVMWHKAVDSQWLFGIFNLLLFAALMVSGLLLLYGVADWHEVSSDVHYWIGLLCPLIFLPHTWRRLVLFGAK